MIRHWIAALAAAAGLGSTNPLHAQIVLCVELGGQLVPVVDAEGLRPVVNLGGKYQSIAHPLYRKVPTKEFVPILVSIPDIQVMNEYTQRGMAHYNDQLEFRGSFVSDYHLEHVFVMLDLRFASGMEQILVTPLGTLEPRRRKPITIVLPVPADFDGQFEPHVFANGHELFTTKMPWDAREQALDAMVARRIQNVETGAPRVFLSLAPEYPKALLRSGIKGEVVLHFRIAENGSVQDAVVKSASNAAMGASALAAIRQWRFIPEVQNGEPVETMADIPIEFTPPPQ